MFYCALEMDDRFPLQQALIVHLFLGSRGNVNSNYFMSHSRLSINLGLFLPHHLKSTQWWSGKHGCPAIVLLSWDTSLLKVAKPVIMPADS